MKYWDGAMNRSSISHRAGPERVQRFFEGKAIKSRKELRRGDLEPVAFRLEQRN